METQDTRDIFGPDPYAKLVSEIRDFAIFLIDAQGRVVSWNEGARLLFGYQNTEIVGQPSDILFTPEDRLAGVPEQEMARASSQGRAEDVRWHLRRDGSRFWTNGVLTALYDDAGNPRGFAKVVQDDTPRKQAEEEREQLIASLEFERARLAHVFARVPAFVGMVHGPKHIFELTNPAYLQLVGHRDLLGKPVREALPDIAGQGYYELLDQVLATGQPYEGRELQVMLQREPNSPPEARWVDFLYEPLLGEGGQPEGIFMHGVDITEQVRSRRQIEFERARLADIFARAPAFVAMLRGPEHVFELANPAYLQLVGYRDLLGKPAREALPEVTGQGYFELLDQVLATGQPYEGHELRVMLQREPDGLPEQRIVDLLYQPLFEADGSVSGIFAHGIDVTEAVRARDEAVRARQAAEEANRIKDEFLATLSHELRTPLSAILGWARMLRAGNVDEATTATALATIERNAQAQAQLIEDILDVSRVITGKMRLDVRSVDLASIIEEAVNTILPAAEAKGVRVQRVLDSGASIVSGDPTRLQQVIWNLLSNAMKFTPRGGRVQIRLERVHSHIEIVVSDNGQGIAPQVLPHIFERFHQADSSSTRSHGGLGLGLAIVRHLVELHGGSVEAESAGLGLGTTFTVKLPLVAVHQARDTEQEQVSSAAASGAASSERPSPLAGVHVLIVDDEDDTRTLLRAVLEQGGARVTSTCSASEALSKLREERPDVLVSDIGMPEEDGYSLIQKVRALPAEQGGQTPAAALTAYARVEDRTRVLSSGFQLHVPKPVEPVELVAVVASLAGRPLAL